MHNPLVPETLEGWSVLHLMYRVGWDSVRRLGDDAGSDGVRTLVIEIASFGAPEAVPAASSALSVVSVPAVT